MRFLILFVSLFITCLSCQKKVSSDIPPEIIENKAIPTIVAENFETTTTDSGIVNIHLKAQQVLVFPKRNNPPSEAYYEFPKGFHMQRYNQNQKIESEMYANYGKYYAEQEKVYASGNVIMINSKGDTLKTEELNYDRKKDLIYSDRFVSIHKEEGDIQGSGGFRSDAQMTHWEFKKTQGHVYVEDQ